MSDTYIAYPFYSIASDNSILLDTTVHEGTMTMMAQAFDSAANAVAKDLDITTKVTDYLNAHGGILDKLGLDKAIDAAVAYGTAISDAHNKDEVLENLVEVGSTGDWHSFVSIVHIVNMSSSDIMFGLNPTDMQLYMAHGHLVGTSTTVDDNVIIPAVDTASGKTSCALLSSAANAGLYGGQGAIWLHKTSSYSGIGCGWMMAYSGSSGILARPVVPTDLHLVAEDISGGTRMTSVSGAAARLKVSMSCSGAEYSKMRAVFVIAVEDYTP